MFDSSQMLSDVNSEIERLTKIRDLLMSDGNRNGKVNRPLEVKALPEEDTPAAITAPARKKRNMSPEGRAAIAAASKRRWAAVKKGKSAPAKAAKKAAKAEPTRHISEEGRRKLSLLAKKRWRESRKNGLSMTGVKLKAGTKKAAKTEA